MDLSLSEEESLIRDSAERISGDAAADTSPDENGHKAWSLLVESGLTELRVSSDPDERVTSTATRLVVQELARGLYAAPYLGHYLGTDLFARIVDEEKSLVEAIDPDQPLVPGFNPGLTELGSLDEELRIPDTSQGASVLAFQESAPLRKLALFAATTELENIDPGRWAARANNVERPLILPTGLSSAEFLAWKAFALTMIAADIIGVMEGALQLAVDYAGQRQQFGKPIGSFQAVQHLLAEQKVGLAAADACVRFAAWAVDELALDEALLAAHTAKAIAAENGRELVEAVLQVHGGMGMTWDCDVHRYLRRVNLDRMLLGDEHIQYAEIARLRGRTKVDADTGTVN